MNAAGFATGIALGLLTVGVFYIVAKPGIVTYIGNQTVIALNNVQVPIIGNIPPDVVNLARTAVENAVRQNLP